MKGMPVLELLAVVCMAMAALAISSGQVASATLCYQENEITASGCGDSAGGSYYVNNAGQMGGWASIFDANWLTGAIAYSPDWVIFTYVKPATLNTSAVTNITSTCARMYNDAGEYAGGPYYNFNTTVPASCLNHSSGNVTYKWYSAQYANNNLSIMYCLSYDNATYLTMRTFGNTTNGDCSDPVEEGTWWGLNDAAGTLTQPTWVLPSSNATTVTIKSQVMNWTSNSAVTSGKLEWCNSTCVNYTATCSGNYCYFNATQNINLAVVARGYLTNSSGENVTEDWYVIFALPDTTPPTLSVVLPASSSTYYNSTVSLNTTADETIDTWWYKLNAGTNTTFTPNTTITAAPGSNTLLVYANDSSGNIGSSSVTFTYDNLSWWWDSSWKYARNITVDQNDIDENLSNFTFLVKLDSTRINYSFINDDGSDLRFIDSENNSLIYQIERWNESETSYVWVKANNISESANTSIVMYYGNTGAPGISDEGSTWSGESLTSRWDLNGDANDSLSANNATIIHATPLNTAKIAGGYDFIIGNVDYIFLNSFTAATSGTVCGWFNPDTVSTEQPLVCSHYWNTPSNTKFCMVVGATSGYFGVDSISSYTSNIVRGNTTMTAGYWNFGCIVSSGTAWSLYGNGKSEAVTVTSGSNTGDWFGDFASNRYAFGAFYTSGGMYADAILDEIKLYSDQKSAAWIKALYESENDSMATFGSEITIGGYSPDTTPPMVTITSPTATTYTTTAIWLNVTANETINTWWLNNGTGNYTFTPNITIATYISQGSNTIRVWANDSSGNKGTDTVTFTVDSILPTLTYVTPTINLTLISGDYLFINVTADEDLNFCKFNLYYDGSQTNTTMAVTGKYCTLNATSLPEYLYLFRIFANDTAGNWNVTKDEYALVDKTPPNINWNTPASNNTFTQNVTWIYTNVTLSETPSACLLDVNGTENYSMTIDGSYCHYNLTNLINQSVERLIVYANDSMGNLNRTTGEWWVTVNLTSGIPASTITITVGSPVATTYYNSSIQLNVSANDTIVAWWYKLNAGTNTTFTPNTTITATLGSNTVLIYANNSVGDIGSASVTFTYNQTIYCSGCQCINDTMNGNISNVLTIYLTASVSNWVGDCINFNGADHKTLDCQGFVIDGDNTGTDMGIKVQSNAHNNTIQNCTVQEFDTCFQVRLSNNNTLTNITAQTCESNGIWFNSANNNIVEDFKVTGCSSSAPFSGAVYFNTVTTAPTGNNLSNGNVSYNDEGIVFASGNNNTFTNVNSTSNSANGVFLSSSASYNTFETSLIKSNAYGIYGYSSFTGAGNSFDDVNVSYNNNGIYLDSSGANNNFTNLTVFGSTGSYNIYLASGNSTFDTFSSGYNGAGYNIYLDGGDYNNFRNGTVESTYGNRLQPGSNYNTFTNITINGTGFWGVLILNSSSNNLTNLEMMNGTTYGLQISGVSNNNTVTGCNIAYNAYGLYLTASGGVNPMWNLIYNNNITNNTNQVSAVGTNYWNTTDTVATNIIGGTHIGGNYWANSAGNGFSDVCVDSAGDGICDFAYTISSSNIDYLPLTDSSYTGINIVIASPLNTTYSQSNRTVWLNVTTGANSASVSTWWYNNGMANTTFTPNTTITSVLGSNCLTIWANDSISEMNSSSICWSYYNFTSVSVVVNSTGHTNYTYSSSPGSNETFNLTASASGGESNATMNFSTSGDLANTSRFIVFFTYSEIWLANAGANTSLVTIETNSTLSAGTYSGNITWLNRNDTTNNGTIEFNITVASQAASIKFLNATFVVAFTAGGSQSLNFSFWNKGNFDATTCNLTYSGAATVAFSNSSFIVSNTTNVTILATWTGSALTETPLLTITCNATSSAGITSDTISGAVAISAAGGPGGGGGGGTITVYVSGNWSIVQPNYLLVVIPGTNITSQITLDNKAGSNITEVDLECIPSNCVANDPCSCVNLCNYIKFGNITFQGGKLQLQSYSISPGQTGTVPFTVDFTKEYAESRNLPMIETCANPYSFSVAVTIGNVTQPISVYVVSNPALALFGPSISWLQGSTTILPPEWIWGYEINVPNWALALGASIGIIAASTGIYLMVRPKSKRIKLG